MKFISKLLFSVALTFVAATAFATASSQSNAAVTAVQAGQAITGGYGPVEILFAANNANYAGCTTAGNRNGYAIDPTTAQGRAAIVLAITAYLAGKTVNAFGAGTCSIYSGVEDLGYLITTD